MTESNINSTPGLLTPTARLQQRDYLFLPLISLGTVLFVLGCSEFLTRIIWPEQTTDVCSIERTTRFKPNCSARLKNAEGPWATYNYNDCGYRSADSCQPKRPEAIRIVILGSYISYGQWVPYDRLYFTIASDELSHNCNRPIDVQNLTPERSPIDVYGRVDEALALKPDVVLYLFAPWDVGQKIDPNDLAERNNRSHVRLRREDMGRKPRAGVRGALRPPFDAVLHLLGLDPREFTIDPWRRVRSLLIAKHFLFQDRDNYLATIAGDRDDYLRRPFTAAWRQRFADFDVILGDMSHKMHAAGVPLLVIPVPSRKQAALFSSPQMPPDLDPFAFSREIEMIASKHGAVYVGLVDLFSHVPNSDRLFYVVDNHPTAEAQLVIAKSLVQKLQDGSIPAFSHCVPQQTAKKE